MPEAAIYQTPVTAQKSLERYVHPTKLPVKHPKEKLTTSAVHCRSVWWNDRCPDGEHTAPAAAVLLWGRHQVRCAHAQSAQALYWC